MSDQLRKPHKAAARCGYEWHAPFISPLSVPRIYWEDRPPQVCVLPENHDGDHRSAGNVTASNRHKFQRAMEGSVCGYRTPRGYGHSSPCWRAPQDPIHS